MPEPKVYVYEEYATPKAKRAAQKGASRGKPTGIGCGFIFVFDRTPSFLSAVACVEAVASVFRLDPGDPPRRPGYGGWFVNTCHVSLEHLSSRCRRVGLKHLTGEWKELADELLAAE